MLGNLAAYVPTKLLLGNIFVMFLMFFYQTFQTQNMSRPVDLADRDELIKAASTSLNSKVISNNASLLAPLAVDAMLSVIDPATATNVDLRDIAVVKKLGGTIDDTELVHGLVFTQKVRLLQ